jgi:hypothetical protein
MTIVTRMRALLVVLLAGAAHAQPVEEFRWSAPLTLDPTAVASPYYRFVLPRVFYAGARGVGFSDLRVYNGAGEAVPMASLPADTVVQQAVPLQRLTLFPVRVAATVRDLRDIDLAITRTPQRTDLRITTRAGGDAAGDALAGYLLDAGRNVTFAGLRVCDVPAALNTRVSVDMSDDLVRWQPVSSGAPLLAIDYAGNRLERTVIDFPPHSARYWRINGAWGQAPPLTCVEGIAPQRQVDAERERLTVSGTAVPEHPGEVDYDLGASLPVDRVALAFADTNTVASLTLSARNDAQQPWQVVGRGLFYRVEQPTGAVESAALPVQGGRARYWRVRADPAAGAFGKRLPQLVVGWPAETIVFVARGGGPYAVAWGQASAQPAMLALPALFPNAPDARAVAASVPVATVGPAVEGRRAEGMAPAAQRRVALWAVLVVAALVLGGMGLGLARQMKAGEGAPKPGDDGHA